jgi:protocatechuate 3,4-dioxygenase beta subunit
MRSSVYAIRAILVTFATLAFAGASEAQQFHTAPANAPARAAIADSTERGSRLLVSGRVLGSDGKPIAGASIYAYQTDANGEYVVGASGGGSDRPRLFAYLRSDAQGRYSFTTIKPGSYPNSRNPGHIHFEIAAPGRENRVYEIVFENDPYLSDAFRAQARIPFSGVEIVTARSANGVLEVAHDIRVR